MKILIGTLYSGENEFEASKRSIQQQSYTKWEQVVFKNLPNKEAHDKLYRCFMDNADHYDLFIKLDADMVFSDKKALQKIVDLFREQRKLDHVVLAVKDWASGLLIQGLHIFSNRVQWPKNEEQLFVDIPPRIEGKRWVTRSPPAPLVIHSPNPSPLQAFRFGVHRAGKIVQAQEPYLRLYSARRQFFLLSQVWKHFREDPQQKLGLVVAGGQCVLKGKLDSSYYNQQKAQLSKFFQSRYKNLTTEELYNLLVPYWGSMWRRRFYFVKSVGMGRLIEGGWRALWDKIFK